MYLVFSLSLLSLVFRVGLGQRGGGEAGNVSNWRRAPVAKRPAACAAGRSAACRRQIVPLHAGEVHHITTVAVAMHLST